MKTDRRLQQLLRPQGEGLMYYVIIGRDCATMQQELATAVQGREDFRVILNRRYGERRADGQPKSPDRRRKERRRRPDFPPADADA
jgi:hypothetical protein